MDVGGPGRGGTHTTALSAHRSFFTLSHTQRDVSFFLLRTHHREEFIKWKVHKYGRFLKKSTATYLYGLWSKLTT